MVRRLLQWSFVVIVPLAVVVAALSAEAQQRTREDAKARAGEAKSAVGGAPATAEGGALTGVTFQDVLANPDDPQINLAYARQLIAEGRLGLASATLERVLLLRPDLDEVRLLYAVVQYRIDNLDEARSELELLLGKPLTPAAKAEAERYLALIVARSKPLQRRASLTLGLHHDDNRNAFPGGGDFLVLNLPVQSTLREKGDWGQIVLGNAEYRYDTGQQRVQEVYANGSVLIDNQSTLDDLDVQALLTEVGLTYKSAWAKFVPKAGWNYIELSGRKYVADMYLGLGGERQLSQAWTVAGELRYGVENFSNNNDTPFGAEQDGDYFSAGLDGYYTYSPTIRMKTGYKFRDKTADVNFNGYQSHMVEGEVLRLLPRNGFLIFSASLERQYYDTVDPFVTTTKDRKDSDWNVGLTYGIPFGEAVGVIHEVVNKGDRMEAGVPKSWRDVLLSVSANYTLSDSNIPNYDYNNWRLQALMTKSWNF